ncbi:hypothetical protein BASA81_003853 [Batrachochytrium salamandrivorans]|nr:hypothetical protein BASA81_003853 [Batrachochytrium salamandrivorans]
MNFLQGQEQGLGDAIAAKVNKTHVDQFVAHLAGVHELMFKATKAVLKHVDQEELAMRQQTLEAQARELSNAAIQIAHIRACADKAVTEIKQHYLEQDGSMASDRFVELLKQPSLVAVESHEYYKKFLLASKLKRAGSGGGDEDEIEVVRQEGDEESELQRFKCPYSLELMRQAMKNSTCGHTYDKSSLPAILKSKKCPVRGCKRAVEEANLIADGELQYDIDEYNEQQQQRISKQQKKIKKPRIVEDTD